MNRVIHRNNLPWLVDEPDEHYDLIYIDPPFNTGKRQRRQRIRTIRDDEGNRQGFGGARYRTEKLADSGSYDDYSADFIGFMEPRLAEARRILRMNGSLFVHLDYREVHYIKVVLDQVFGSDCFMGEIIWAYDFGGRSKYKWPTKHDTILWYAKNPEDYVFNIEEAEKIVFKAPGLEVGDEPIGDVWWHTIVGTNSKEKTGYPTQKPIGLIERIVKVHSNSGDHLLDFFAGSGTFGEAAGRNGRIFTMVDSNAHAVGAMMSRLARFEPELVLPDVDFPPSRG
jgi:site-specific DNA-methyltransferase (adenine-specific)